MSREHALADIDGVLAVQHEPTSVESVAAAATAYLACIRHAPRDSVFARHASLVGPSPRPNERPDMALRGILSALAVVVMEETWEPPMESGHELPKEPEIATDADRIAHVISSLRREVSSFNPDDCAVALKLVTALEHEASLNSSASNAARKLRFALDRYAAVHARSISQAVTIHQWLEMLATLLGRR